MEDNEEDMAIREASLEQIRNATTKQISDLYEILALKGQSQ